MDETESISIVSQSNITACLSVGDNSFEDVVQVFRQLALGAGYGEELINQYIEEL